MSEMAPVPGHDSVMAVIVTYQPDPALLLKVLQALRGQVGWVLVFDNASGSFDVRQCEGAVEGMMIDVRVSSSNIGVAAAINAGFATAARQRFDHLLILDQDSIVAPGMVKHLLRAVCVQEEGRPIAAVGPVFEDRRSGMPAPFIRIGPLLNRKLFIAAGQVVEADFLISSGTLVPLAVIEDVGPMDDSLFIDNVDLEWSFRARANGYRLLGVGDARMQHAIGDELKLVSVLGWQLEVSLHSPVRLYYMTRNRIALYARRQVPWGWVMQDIPRLLLKFVGMSLCVAPRWRNCRAMLRGMADALRGRLGPAPAEYLAWRKVSQ